MATSANDQVLIDPRRLSHVLVDSCDCPLAESELFSGFGKMTLTNRCTYEGTLENNQMHGHGKFTWPDGTIYEGEFQNNIMSGRGVYMWTDGSTFDGEVVSGIRHGSGTFRSANGQTTYTGQWVNGERHGNGRLDYDDSGSNYYEGGWWHGMKHGYGCRRYRSSNVYEGMWYRDQRHGEGTMRWMDRDEIYVGQWENGVQHGQGKHIWFSARAEGSQYSLRNGYMGSFVRGRRSGAGTFYYASGAKYEGEWRDDAKHGRGKFTFKNGRVYDGCFENDRIVDHADVELNGDVNPASTQIRTRTPLPFERSTLDDRTDAGSVVSSFKTDLQHLLVQLESGRYDDETVQAQHAVVRFLTPLRKIYAHYSALGTNSAAPSSLDNTYIMLRLQFWRFLKDCRFHLLTDDGCSLLRMDRILASLRGEEDLMDSWRVHDCFSQIMFRDFVIYLVTLGYFLSPLEARNSPPVIANCFARLLQHNVLPGACAARGYLFNNGDVRRVAAAMQYCEKLYALYKSLCVKYTRPPYDFRLTMRKFLLTMNEYGLVRGSLTAQRIVQILATDDPRVLNEDGDVNLEIEMSFLEFFEALLGCAEEYVTVEMVHQFEMGRETSLSTVISGDCATPNPLSAYQHPPGVGTVPSLDQLGAPGSQQPQPQPQPTQMSLSMPQENYTPVEKEQSIETMPVTSHASQARLVELPPHLLDDYTLYLRKLQLFFEHALFPVAERFEKLRKRVADREKDAAEKKRIDDLKNSMNVQMTGNELPNDHEKTLGDETTLARQETTLTSTTHGTGATPFEMDESEQAVSVVQHAPSIDAPSKNVSHR